MGKILCAVLALGLLACQEDEQTPSDKEMCDEVEERLEECGEEFPGFSELCTSGDNAECIREHCNVDDDCGDFLDGLTQC